MAAIVGVLIALVAALASPAALAQDYDEFPLDGFPEDETFSARRMGDYVIVADDDYCRMLIGATFGSTARYLPERLVGKASSAQRRGLTRFAAPADANTALCADVLSSLGSTILPESLAPLLELAGQAEPEAPSGEGLTIEGNGPWVSGRFRLEGGTYLALVAASGCDSWDAVLFDADGDPMTPEPITATDLIEDLEPGLYYWSVTASDCDWSLRTLPEEG
jgi:hypothetical protein